MENLIYIVLGVIFFIVQIYRESEKLKKQSRPRQEPHLPERREQGEFFPASKKEKPEREVVFPHTRSPETASDRLKNVNERTGRHYRSERSGPAEQQLPVNKANDSVENNAAGKTISSKKKTVSDNEYAGMFKNPQSVRGAFIASEIFNRRHF